MSLPEKTSQMDIFRESFCLAIFGECLMWKEWLLHSHIHEIKKAQTQTAFLPTCSGTVYRSCWIARLGRAGFCSGCWTHIHSSFDPTGAGEGFELAVWLVGRHPLEPGYRCCAGSGGNPKDGRRTMRWKYLIVNTPQVILHWRAPNLDVFTFISHLFLRRTITSTLLDWQQWLWFIQKEPAFTHTRSQMCYEKERGC